MGAVQDGHGQAVWRCARSAAIKRPAQLTKTPRADRCAQGGGRYVNHSITPTSGPLFDKGMHEGKGYFYRAEECQTFWARAEGAGAYCKDPMQMDRACVVNYTRFIPGDLTMFDVTTFETFLKKNASAPFLAYLALSTNHVPHYALPEWFHAYTDALGKPAGDYLGTLSQMDNSLGVLRGVLRKYGVESNTMVWFSTGQCLPAHNVFRLCDRRIFSRIYMAHRDTQTTVRTLWRIVSRSTLRHRLAPEASWLQPTVSGSAKPPSSKVFE
eukprot:COSAG01_NODE_1357_length_10597_cov_2.476948_3_plen_269_part_00